MLLKFVFVEILKFVCVKLLPPILISFEHQAGATYPLMKWYKSKPKRLCAFIGISILFSWTLKLQKSWT